MNGTVGPEGDGEPDQAHPCALANRAFALPIRRDDRHLSIRATPKE
ncbi:hypothetical protein ACLQ25_08870 [Micromonospora sp. DT44]